MSPTKPHGLRPSVCLALCLAMPLALQAQPMPPEQAMHERDPTPTGAPRFSTAQMQAAHGYYAQEGHQGYAMPPHTRADAMPMARWQRGQALPKGAMAYPLPRPLILAIGTAPTGYHYVRIDRDILLVAETSGMVVDALEDVAR